MDKLLGNVVHRNKTYAVYLSDRSSVQGQIVRVEETEHLLHEFLHIFLNPYVPPITEDGFIRNEVLTKYYELKIRRAGLDKDLVEKEILKDGADAPKESLALWHCVWEEFSVFKRQNKLIALLIAQFIKNHPLEK